MKNLPFPNRFFVSAILCGAALSLFTIAARAQDAGDLDTSFATGPVASGRVTCLALQSNGQVLAGGPFNTFRSTARNGIARLNANGTLDTFNPGLSIQGSDNNPPSVQALSLLADGQVLATGSFTVRGQATNGGVVRLNADGTLDTKFNAGTGVADDGEAVGTGLAIVALSGGKALVGGSFITFDGVQSAGLVRLNPDGSVDTTFNPGGAGITGNGYGVNGGDVTSISVQADGHIYIGGHFSAYNGVAEGCVARLNADGTLDTSFNDGEGADEGVNALAVQSNGQILVGGGFNDFDGVAVPHIVRLNTDGSLDTSYYPENGYTIEEVDSIIAQPDGTALVGGVIYSSGGLVFSPVGSVVRILADGTQDPDFAVGGTTGQALALALQPDGQALVASNSDPLVGTFAGDVYRIYDLSSTPTVTITAGTTATKEDGSSGPASFVVSVSPAPSTKLKVHYAVKGTAISGFDYTPLSGKVKFKPGETSKTISVSPIDEGINDGSVVTVKAVLQGGSGYAVGSPKKAKVKIVDNQ